ncbi:conserved hypothetical protein [Histoplasma capsulatum H143]|uniref:Uncharacterized protein n=1 Tax=Ajellomyces capsulatus (strain H143) TaxID=544712 RepID=C6H553_AJECH|nr:conserved hypothetical protein [Histoplasma capsulatum H143]
MSSRSKSIGQSIGAAHQAQRIAMDDSDIPSQLSLFILFSSAHIIFFANIGLDRVLILVLCVHRRQVPRRQETSQCLRLWRGDIPPRRQYQQLDPQKARVCRQTKCTSHYRCRIPRLLVYQRSVMNLPDLRGQRLNDFPAADASRHQPHWTSMAGT